MLSLTVIRDSLDLWTPTVEHILRMQLSFVQQVRMLKMYLDSFQCSFGSFYFGNNFYSMP